MCSLLLLQSPQSAEARGSWDAWKADLKREVVASGIPPSLFDRAMASARQPDRKVKKLNKSQPERRLSFLKYRSSRADAARIRIGRQKYAKYKSTLSSVERRYGVDSCVIASIWGLETAYGGFKGSFPVIPSLATLAYDSNRKAFFRKQLIQAFHIVHSGQVSLGQFVGEWAGASGHPQFLPTSWKNYAVDYNGDGRKDIWNSIPDALGSIANYLRSNGWQAGQPWAVEVRLPRNFSRSHVDRKTRKSAAEWKAMGVQVPGGVPSSLSGRIVTPDGGPAFLAFRNFDTIMTYNNSTYYAGTVGWMADQICRR
ncbi:lytic murein transglycosylase [Biformimicrobium ophioploci]|uniref:Lytic murein transglycosylase n=1 Tax=Biformimicrobium ophioploci TaxID=3036711 RepID=A0ABQ6M0G9_9GAMM|nr:lytic murein transglycosylase [Microbulbifer sp. NKW57]